MGADNWRYCPRCLKKVEADKFARHEKAAKAYGKVPPEEWKALVAEAEKEPDVETNFREDYELGVTDDGKFYVSYSGRCTTCGFAHRFKHEEKLVIPSP